VLHATTQQRRETREDVYAGQLIVVDLIQESSVGKTLGLVINISNEGMAVQTLRPLVQGKVAVVNLSQDDAPVLKSKGVVVWEKPGGLSGVHLLSAPLKISEILLKRDASSRQSALPLSAQRDDSKTEFDNTLHLLAYSAMTRAGANGAAIVIGNSSGMECRASVGNAPEVGTKLRTDSGLSGQSASTGAIILCNDAWSDSHVNPAAARQTDTRSIVIIPIRAEKDVAGLLEAFSPDKDHFTESHVEQLQPLVSVLAEAIKEETSRKTDEGRGPIPLSGVIETESVQPKRDSALHSLLADHPGLYPIAGYMLAALLVLAGTLIWLAVRNNINKSSRNGAQAVQSGNTSQSGNAIAKPSISFDPPVIKQTVGATFDVNVVIKGAHDLWSAPMQILYDPKKLQLITVMSGDLLNRDGQSATLVQRVDENGGRISISISRPLSAPGISGDGVVFSVVFLSKAKGSSKLRIDQTGLRDTSTKVLPAIISEAAVNISRVTLPGEGTDDQGETNVPRLPQSVKPLTANAMAIGNDVEVTPGRQSTIADLPLPSAPPAYVVHSSASTDPAFALAARSQAVPIFALERTLTGHANWVTTVTFSADGRHLLSSSWDKSVKLWDVDTGRVVSTITSKGAGIQALAVSHDGRLMATEDAENNIVIRSTRGAEIRTIKGDRPPWDNSWVYSIAFSPDDRTLAAALDSRTVQLWDVDSGRVVRTFSGASRTFLYMAFSPDGRWLATGGDSRTIDLWNVDTGKVVKTLKGHRQDVYAVLFSSDGQWLASASKDKTVRLWDVSSGREVHTLTGHQSLVTSLAFSPNERWLASSGWDKTIKIWDVKAGREVQTLTGHTHQIYSLAFNSRGGWLATGSEDGTIKLWRLRKEIDLAVLGEGNNPGSTPVAFNGLR